RLGTVLRWFECALDLGTPTAAFRRVLAASGRVGTIIAADALAARADFFPPSLQLSSGRPELGHSVAPPKPQASDCSVGEGALVVAADEEALPFREGSLDLVVSGLALQFVNDLPGTLVQIRRVLKPDGLFLGALTGGETLTELRQSFIAAESEIEGGISPRVIPFADLRDMGALLQRAGFALPVTDIDRRMVRYSSPLTLM